MTGIFALPTVAARHHMTAASLIRRASTELQGLDLALLAQGEDAKAVNARAAYLHLRLALWCLQGTITAGSAASLPPEVQRALDVIESGRAARVRAA